MNSDDKLNSLFSAVRNGRLSEVRELVGSFGLPYLQTLDGALFCEAIQNKHTEIVKFFLANGFAVNCRRKRPSDTPLHCAIRNGDKELVELLISYCADVNSKTYCWRLKEGHSPLHLATQTGNEEIARLLLDNHAFVDIQDGDGVTPLHIAAEKGDMRIALLLLQYGALINIKCNSLYSGYTPLHYAAQYGKGEIVKLFLNKGCIIDSSSSSSPLHIAARHGYLDVVETLLNFGADVHMKNKSCFTPLHLAAQHGHVEIVKLLLKSGADVNARGCHGCTPLHLVADSTHNKALVILLDAGADINLANDRGQLPLYNTLDELSAWVQNSGENGPCNPAYFVLKETSEILIKHIVLLESRDVIICEENLRLIESNEEVSSFKRKCDEEIKRGRKQIDNTIVSFYDILFKDVKQLSKYAENESILRAIEFDLHKEFPIFADIIEKQFNLGLERKKLLQQCGTFFDHFIFKLPYGCIVKISDFLSGKDLTNIIEATHLT